MEKLLKIGEIARLNSISIQTLRYYESMGLITPDYIDHMTKYRYYAVSQSARIDMIQMLKALDFSLLEIKSLLAQQDLSDVIYQILTDKAHILKQQQQELAQKIILIKNFRRATKIYQDCFHKTELELVSFAPRYIYSYKIDKNIYEMTKEEYEYSLREFKQYLIKQNLPPYYFNCVGSLIPHTDFINQRYISNELFVFTHAYHKKIIKDIKLLKAGTYAVYYCHCFEQELTAIRELDKKIKHLNLQVKGNYICEVLYENNLHTNERNMFMRLQIRVQ